MNKGVTFKAIIGEKEQKAIVEAIFTALEEHYTVVQTGRWRFRDKGFDGELSCFFEVIPKEKVQ